MPRDLPAEARALDGAARHHKREERRHRKAARAAREKLAQILDECSRLGISVHLSSTGEGNDPWPTNRCSTSTP
jgi:hypothetical protein